MERNRRVHIAASVAIGLLIAANILTGPYCRGAGDEKFALYSVHATSSVTLQLPVPEGTRRILFLDEQGTWQTADADIKGKLRLIRLPAARMKGGATTLLVNPPDWMDCSDRTPPAVTSITIDGKALPAEPVIDLGTTGDLPREFMVSFADAASPIAENSVVAVLNGQRLGEEAVSTKVDGHTARCDVRIPELAFGVHTLVVQAVDKSPFRNVGEARLSFSYVDTKNVAQAAMGAKVLVSSCFSNYTAQPLNNGDWQSCASSGGSAVTWASAETPTDHWIEVVLPKPEQLGSVALYWAAGRPSKRVEAQVLRDGTWTTIGVAERDRPDQASTIIRFDPVTADRVRVFQPAGHGREDRPNLMWVGEIAVRKAD